MACLLDSITTKVAWDLKRLRTAYTGACLRVRNLSTNAETDIGFDSDGNLDWTAAAAAGASLLVAVIYDQSGNGNDLTVPNILRYAFLNQTTKAIDFDGQGRTYSTQAIDLTGTGAVSIFQSFKFDGAATMVLCEFGENSNTVPNGFELYTDAGTVQGGGTLASSAYNLKSKTAAQSVFHTASLIIDKSLALNQITKLRVDGSSSGATEILSQSIGTMFGNLPLFVGSRNFDGAYLNGAMKGMVIAAAALSDASRNAIENGLGVQNGGGTTPTPIDQVIFELDSLQAGDGGTATQTVAHLAAVEDGNAGSFKATDPEVSPNGVLISPTGKARNYLNLAQGSRTYLQFLSDLASEVGSRSADSNGGTNQMVVEGGYNDFGGGNKSAAQVFGYAGQVADYCAANSITFYPSTLTHLRVGTLDQAGVDAHNAKIDAFNASMIGAFAANRLLRPDRNTITVDPATGTLSDGVHRTLTAKAAYAKDALAMLNGTYTRPAITTSPTLAAATAGTATERVIAADNSPTVWQLKSGSLPTGMTFDPSNHKFVLGANVPAGTYSNLRVWAIDANNRFDEQTFSIVVNPSGTPPDATAPTGAVTAPVSGQVVNSVFTLTASAADNVAVAAVQFQIDNANFGAADSSSPYSVLLDTAQLSNGAHTARAIIVDTAGNAFTTPAVNFTVNNAAPGAPQKIRIPIAAPNLATGIRIKRTTDNLTDFPLIRDIANVAAFDDTVNLEVGKTYYYRMATRNANGVYSEYGEVKTIEFQNG